MKDIIYYSGENFELNKNNKNLILVNYSNNNYIFIYYFNNLYS